MAVLAYPGQLQNAQTGNADSTNTIVRQSEVNLRAMVLRITSTIGATPTVTVNIVGSFNGTDFFNIPYSILSDTTNAWSIAALTITTAVTNHYELLPGQGWRYIKVVMSANTNVTLTTDLF